MKRIFTCVILVMCVLVLCACGNKKVISNEDLTSKLTQMGFDVNDITDVMEDTNIKTVKTANNRMYQIDYYVFKSDELAKKAYSSNVEMFEKNKKNKGNKKSKENYDKYEQTTNDYYNVVSRIDNTLIYVSVNVSHKKDVKKVLRKLNF